jgi:hypothetical protein
MRCVRLGIGSEFFAHREKISVAPARASDDEAVVSMCMALNAEDPGAVSVRSQRVQS